MSKSKKRSSTRRLPKYARAAVKVAERLRIQKAALKLAYPKGGPDSKQLWGETHAAAAARDDPSAKLLRKAYGYTGAGDYSMGRLMRGGFFNKNPIIASNLRRLGYSMGGLPGLGIADIGSRWAGFGDYSAPGSHTGLSTNQIMGGPGSGITVNASDDYTGDIYLSHKEFVGNVTASVALATGQTNGVSTFSLLNYEINPGLTTTFPWLSQVAENFTLYKFMGCIFEYRPTSGEFGTTGTNALGKVIMATQYDPDAPDFLSSVQMENYDYAQSNKPSLHQAHGVETASASTSVNMMYVRVGPTTKDKIFTDVGRFQIATEGIPLVGVANTTVIAPIGELWVTYRIRLSRANLFSNLLGNSIASEAFVGSTPINPINSFLFQDSQNFVSTSPFAAKYGIPPTISAAFSGAPKLSNNLGCTISSKAVYGFDLTFPKNIVQGTYCVIVEHRFSTATQSTGKYVILGSIVNGTFVPNSDTTLGLPTRVPDNGNGTTLAKTIASIYWINVTAPGTLQCNIAFSFGGGVNPTPATDSFVTFVTVTQVANAMIN